MFDGPAVAGGLNVGRQLDDAVASGVESLRVTVDWAATQPYPTAAAVPGPLRSSFDTVGGVPTRVGPLDELVGAAAARDLSILPVIEYTPNWAAKQPGNSGSPPKSPLYFAAFLTALVNRYGPHGTFWSSHPSLPVRPIRMWQIWNEPHFSTYWATQPFAASYVSLLAAARRVLDASDPGAKIVLAGLADVSWQYLAQIYKVPGASRTFDVVAIHPYTASANGVITILQKARAVMNQYGDSQKPIMATEITWPSSQGRTPPQFGVGTTEGVQAQRLNQVMPLLVANRAKLGLTGFYWYTWMGDEGPRASYGFDFAGLLKYVNGTVSAKPALAVYKRWALSIEGCQRKGSDAGSCA
jgi:hypothetical protein